MGSLTSKRRAPCNIPGPSYRAVIRGVPMGCPTPAGTPYTWGRMAPPRPSRARDRQRGNTLLIALIVMSALATLGSLTVVSVQSSLKTSTNDRAQAIAMYAAESGAAVAMDYLRTRWSQDFKDGWKPPIPVPTASPWSNYVAPPGFFLATAIPGNNVPPEDPSSLFTKDQNASFQIQLLNNRDDPGYTAPFDLGNRINDQDGRIIIRSTGHGPQGSLAIIEWEVQRLPVCPATPACGPPPPGSSWPTDPPPPLILLGWHVVTLL